MLLINMKLPFFFVLTCRLLTTAFVLGPSPAFKPHCDGSKQYIPHPYDCQRYFECSNGIAYDHSCANPLVYDPTTYTCDYPINVHCVPSTTISPTTKTTTTTTTIATTSTTSATPQSTTTQKITTTATAFKPICKGTDQYIPHPYDCQKYYECGNNIAYERFCPANLVFNPITHVCDRNVTVHCIPMTTSTTPPTTTTVATTTTTSTTPPPVTTTTPTTTTSSTTPTPTSTSTTTPTPTTSMSTTAAVLTTTTTTTTTTRKPTTLTTTLQTTTVFRGNCHGTDQYIPHPYNCQKYYECGNGIAYERFCPDNLVFNPLSNVCDRRSSVPGC